MVALLFALAYGLGLLQRKRRAVHSRLMACTPILLVDPVLGRLMYFNLPPFPGLLWYQAVTFSLSSLLILLTFCHLVPGPASDMIRSR